MSELAAKGRTLRKTGSFNKVCALVLTCESGSAIMIKTPAMWRCKRKEFVEVFDT